MGRHPAVIWTAVLLLVAGLGVIVGGSHTLLGTFGRELLVLILIAIGLFIGFRGPGSGNEGPEDDDR